MPEGPEVEVQRQQLSASGGLNRQVTVARRHSSYLRQEIPDLRPLVGQRLRQVRRRGKFLGFVFDQHTLLSHLGMSGGWRIFRGSVPRPDELPHQHVEIAFGGDSHGNTLKWVYVDPRRFGQLRLVPNDSIKEALAGIGLDVLAGKVKVAQVEALLREYRPTLSIKQWLLDQSQLAGIGNIYASEILWLCQIHPATPAHVCSQRAADLRDYSFAVLKQAAEAGGSSIHSYRDARGEEGQAQDAHKVYGRHGYPCPRKDGGTITKYQGVDGRTSYVCPVCQKIGE